SYFGMLGMYTFDVFKEFACRTCIWAQLLPSKYRCHEKFWFQRTECKTGRIEHIHCSLNCQNTGNATFRNLITDL
ncbi:MAG: hypothetical protein IKR76_08165, partial [Ruminococcus sp.]|nr:hypothetical protein [Ruminococcus sp.]